MKALREENVEVVFGHPGGAVLHIYDAIHRHQFRHVLARHEQGAVHMADGYARASGRPGVALVTSGPALTNSITGIATAYADSIPIVVFSGQVATKAIGSDAFQEADNVGLTRPVTKHNYLVKDVRDLGRDHQGGLPHRHHGPAGPRARRHPEGRVRRGVRVPLPEGDPPRALPAVRRGPLGPDQEGARADPPGASARCVYFGGGVILVEGRRRVRAFVEQLARTHDLHADGHRRHPGRSPAVARHARHARHLSREPRGATAATCWSPSARASTIA